MKMIIGIIVALVSAGASMTASASTPSIPGWHAATDGAAVAKAVTDAVNWTAVKCAGTVTQDGKTSPSNLDNDAIKGAIPQAQNVWIKDDLSQPLIRFDLTGDEGSQHLVTSIIVTTTADRKSVVKLDVFQKITARQVQNVGTLDHPVSQTATVDVEDVSGTCQ